MCQHGRLALVPNERQVGYLEVTLALRLDALIIARLFPAKAEHTFALFDVEVTTCSLQMSAVLRERVAEQKTA